MFQDSWYPGVDRGFLYELVGGGPEIDAVNSLVRGELIASGGIDTGIRIEIRSGGAAIGFATVTDRLYDDDSISFGLVGTEAAVRDFSRRPVRAFIAPLDKSPQMIMWDPQTYPGVTRIADLPATATVRHFSEASFIPHLIKTGILTADQLDDQFDGAPETFVAAGGALAQQGYSLIDPYSYEHEFDWRMAVSYELIHDTGFAWYPEAVAVRSDRWDELTPCMQAITPILQQAQVDFVSNPTNAIDLILRSNASYETFWTYSDAAADFGFGAMVADDLVSNGSNNSLGDFDLDRLQSFTELLVASGYAWAEAVSPDDLVSNEFIDESIGL